jgi:hypothetical protein
MGNTRLNKDSESFDKERWSEHPEDGKENQSMNDLNTCPKCGVPDWVSGGQLWLNNGDIVQRGDQRNRLVLCESENIDPLFHNIEEIIGTPIEHIIITAVRRAVGSWISPMFPDELKRSLREKKVDPEQLTAALLQLNRTMGVGRVELIELRNEGDKDDYVITRIYRPFSVPVAVGGIVAGWEAFFGVELGYSFEKISPDIYELKNFPSPHPEEMKKRMWSAEYEHRDGGVELERCPSCGGPIALSRYSWDLDDGIIIDESNKRRMIMLGPVELDLVFRELEAELGATIPRVIVEAQRRFTRNSAQSLFDVTTADEFRTLLAVMGMGYLKDIDVSRKGLIMRLYNAALPLILVGTMQGVFEKALKQESIVEWELSPNNDLDINILALAH